MPLCGEPDWDFGSLIERVCESRAREGGRACTDFEDVAVVSDGTSGGIGQGGWLGPSAGSRSRREDGEAGQNGEFRIAN